jgi:hypothetical protein
MDRRSALVGAVIIVLLALGLIESSEFQIMFLFSVFIVLLVLGFLTLRNRVRQRTKVALNVFGIAALVVGGLAVIWVGAMSGIYWNDSERHCVVDSTAASRKSTDT